jgi:DNA-binding CsgD family transcriptional regulator
MLLGRESERRELESIIEGARTGRSTVLVVRGDPGIGKTAMLEHAADHADGMTVLRCVGIEAEHEMPFAGMHQLVRPVLGLLDRLPEPQAAALRGALGLSFEPVEDRLLVSLGLLSLLAEASEEQPVLCLVDDAQWLDGPSQEALAFVARRLDADPIAVLVSVRTGETRTFDPGGLPRLELSGLGDADAHELLNSHLDRPAAPAVVEQLVHQAHGNPLALLELPAGLTAGQLSGSEPIIGPPPLRGAVEEAFRARAAGLPDSTRRALVVAAADETGDVLTLERAVEFCDLTFTDLDAAERSGLVRIDGVLSFRHPLVRSAIYRSASRGERRAAHEALAFVLDDPVRSAWHRALVAERADEGIAAELEAAGAQAAARGAHATATAAFERAAELSEVPGKRGHRLRMASQASIAAGRTEAALALAERAQPHVADPLDDVELETVRLMVATQRGSPAEALERQIEIAERLGKLEPARSMEMTMGIVWVGLMAGQPDRGIMEARRVLAGFSRRDEAHAFFTAFVDGAAALLDGDHEAANAAWFDQVVDRPAGDPLLTIAGLLWLYVGDSARAREAFGRHAAALRAKGTLAELAGIMPACAVAEVQDRALADAAVSCEDGLVLARQLGWVHAETVLLAVEARIAALRGDEETARAKAAEAQRRGLATGLVVGVQHAQLAVSELELGLGNAREALDHLDELDPNPFPPISVLSTPDYIEAAVRLGETERAAERVERFERFISLSHSPVRHGQLARCRAILAEDPDEAERLFGEALELHGGDVPFDRARTRLAFGERLRRDQRRADARPHLRAALDAFEGLGTRLWAERARGELRATGETARKRDVTTIDDLTGQELRIARLVAEGATNRDVAAQLFLSPKTVEYHLRKVFLKLGVASRMELAKVPLGDPGDEDEGHD